MSKYAPLMFHLKSRHQAVVAMRFSDIEGVLGFNLPPSSRKHRAWWSNNPSNNVMTEAWLAAGYVTKDVDLEAERLVFEKLNAAAPLSGPMGRHALIATMAGTITLPLGTDLNEKTWDEMPGNPSDKPTRRHPLFGIFKDTMWIDPTLDLTEPAYQDGEDWLDEKAKHMEGKTE